jgi:hypothetical protein
LPTVDGKVVLDKDTLEPAGKRKENGREKA